MRLFVYSMRDFDELPCFERLAEDRGFEFDWTSEPPSLDDVGLVEGHDAVSVITTPLDRELLGQWAEAGVRGVATRSIGFDHIDLGAAADYGIRCVHAAYPPEGVADYAIMLMLMVMRKARLVLSLASVQDYGLEGKIGGDISRSTVGIVGTGRIGRTVARHLSGFGCELLAYDPYPSPELDGIATYVSLDELLERSDAITLHAPANEANHHMIGAPQLARMREGAILVNCARGALVDQQALIDALESGHLGGAGLDTLEGEIELCYYDRSRDIVADRDRAVLESFPNVIVSPHMAFYTAVDVHEMCRCNVDGLLAIEHGEDTPLEVRA